ncbi:GTPase family protein [Methylocucumis oryzae]|uniref:GTP-binding protein HSR1-like protein n=1 Tax=Methylocucumis oryzae TaxID=1632867 RepID=A0A0F3IKV0_9GAMM|nr:GTPase [Methylocucumis oryzae]KJV07365.1 GTP-binding protein HSR1-like protein [Methylocucumis oryzae]
MMIPFTRLSIAIAIILILPFLALIGLGVYWLWLKGWLLYGMSIVSAHFALAYALLLWHKHAQQRLNTESLATPSSVNDIEREQLAWQALESVRSRWQQDAQLFAKPSLLLTLSNDVLVTVARQFYAHSRFPLLEFPLPYLLKLITLVCEDLQREVLDNIPGSHAITLGDLLRAKQTLNSINTVRSFFDVGSWLFNWPGAALAKARSVLLGKGLEVVKQEVAKRLVNAYIDKLGLYAIQLYSGQLTLEDISPIEQLTSQSRADIETFEDNPSIEPFRILLLGQVSSGKSSLLNALFGELTSAVDLLPTTTGINPFVLRRQGLEQAIILDSAGVDHLSDKPLAALQKASENVDLILLVCNAAQATRQHDAELLQTIRNHYQTQQVNRALPVILAVATHIDQLRPMREWQPPYNLESPDSIKAHTIRLACTAIAEDLKLALTDVVPVCLKADLPPYNIEEGLIPVIQARLDQAQRVRYLRCLRQQQSYSYWQQLFKQMRNAGRIFS